MAELNLDGLRGLMRDAADTLPDLSGLDQADVDRLQGLLQAAESRQAQTLADATEESLTHVPRLLRGAVRKLLFR